MENNVVVSQVQNPAEVHEVHRIFSFWLHEEDPEWSTGLNDIALELIADPEGLFVAKADGELVATLLAINYDESYSTLGFFRTKRHLRGKGIGGKLWRAGLAHCGWRTVALFSTLKMVELYKRDGFVSFCRTCCYKVENLDRFKISAHEEDPNIKMVDDTILQDILKFDRKYSPAGREKFMTAWLKQPESVALAYIDRGVVLGYGVVRRTYSPGVHRLEPLYASDVSQAEKLARALLSRLAHGDVVKYAGMDVNLSTVVLAESLGAEWVDQDEIMYKNGAPKYDVTGVFAVM